MDTQEITEAQSKAAVFEDTVMIPDSPEDPATWEDSQAVDIFCPELSASAFVPTDGKCEKAEGVILTMSQPLLSPCLRHSHSQFSLSWRRGFMNLWLRQSLLVWSLQ